MRATVIIRVDKEFSEYLEKLRQACQQEKRGYVGYPEASKVAAHDLNQILNQRIKSKRVR